MRKRTRDIDFHVYLSKDENQILENLRSRSTDRAGRRDRIMK